jgi:hypothetical protein
MYDSVDFDTLKKEAAILFEALILIDQTMCHYITADFNLGTDSCEYCISHALVNLSLT